MPRPDTRSRILDAAAAAAAAFGLSRLSLEDVARAAGLSRQTVYRYFGSRDELLSAAILRDEERVIAAISAAAAEHPDLRPALEAALLTALRLSREHPLLDRLLETEPEALLPLLTTGRGPVLNAARPVLEELLAERLPHLSPSIVHRTADTAARLVVSYAVNPPDDPLEEVAAGLADLLCDGLKGEPT